MGTVHDIDKLKPHKVSEVICLKCLNRFISVRPETTRLKYLECEHCGAGYVIETGEHIGDSYY